MDKSDIKVHESQSDTSSVITMKEYAPSEYPSSEPPPAYMKPRSNALRIAKLAAFTVILSSIILGGFILATSWIQANTPRNLDLILNQELLDDLHPSYEHLVASEVLPKEQNSIDNVQSKAEVSDEVQASANDKIVDKNTQSNDEGLMPPPPPPSAAKSEEKKVLDLDEIANILMQKNIKGNVNCIVEKRRNEELVDHAPMSLNLPSANSPFGLNITTPPRLQHLTGEQMIVICKGDEDEDKNAENVEESDETDNKVDDMQSVVFPLPHHLLNQVQQTPQIIPLNSILQHIQLRRFPVHQVPVQQMPMQHLRVQQIPVQHIPVQQLQLQQIPVRVQQVPTPQQPSFQPIQIHQIPVQSLQMQQIPVQQIPVQQINLPPFEPQQQFSQQPQQIVFQQQIVPEQQVQQQQHAHPQQPFRQVILPQKIFVPQPQMMNNQQSGPFPPEMIPLKEVGINQNRIPVNHVLHHRVPINPMAVNDVPISRMQITHLPMRAEPQMKEEPVPVHHLLPPQAHQYQAENFKQDEARFSESPVQFFPPQPSQGRPLPVEVRDPGVLRIPTPMAQEANQFFPNNLVDNREPEFVEENRGFRPLTVDVRPRGQRREPMANPLLPEMPKIIPLNFEKKPLDSGRKIRFPDMVDSEEVRENRMPIITEITKIIPIRLEKEETEDGETPIIPMNPNSQPKNMDSSDIKVEKMNDRPFPIPINAILDMIFRGIRPLMSNQNHFPIPVDIKIERIDSKPLGLMMPPFIKKFEIIKKESTDSGEEESQNAQLAEKNEQEENEKDAVEAKVQRVEVVGGENESGHPVEGENPQPYKIEEQEKQDEANDQSSFEDQAFLPNGQGRGARVFPIPQAIKEAEIFSVFDAKADKNVEGEVPLQSSLTVVNSEEEKAADTPEIRQGRFMSFPKPIVDFLREEKILYPEARALPKLQPQTFTVHDSGSLKLYPVQNEEAKNADIKEPAANTSAEETRPHFVQPRSV